jgi:type VI secretion system protein ImpE
MNAAELFKAGRLAEAVDLQLKAVKSNPADASRRLFLFELLAFTGDRERARKQLSAVQFNKAEDDAGVANYQKLLNAEEARAKVFRDGQRPLFFSEPPAHVNLRLQAVELLRAGRTADAKALLDLANAMSPMIRGTCNDKSFVGLRDEDDLFGSVLEVFAPQGAYYWLPLEHLEALAMNPPKSPRDLLWSPVWMQVREGAAGHAWLPIRYPDSHDHQDELVKLGRVTEWIGVEGGPVRGAGMHTFRVGDEFKGLLEWRQMDLLVANSADGNPS